MQCGDVIPARYGSPLLWEVCVLTTALPQLADVESQSVGTSYAMQSLTVRK
jgi:hypothetical protein